MELTRTLSVGFGVNFWRDTPINDNGWTQTVERQQEISLNGGPPVSSSRTTIERYSNVSGESFNIGTLWSVTDRFNLGIRYETALDADADYSLRQTSSNFPDLSIDEHRRLKIPATFVFGGAFRVNDKLTLAADVSTTDWDNFYAQRADGTRFSLVDASDLEDGVNFDRTWTVRLGAEYLFLPEPEKLGERLDYLWSLRGGLLFDSEPASGRSTTDSAVPPTGNPDSFYGVSIGVGLLAFQRVNFDLAYQFRFGLGVNSDFVRGVPGFEEDAFQHRVLFSTIIYF
jgi:long-subunit fatty acid transport protein